MHTQLAQKILGSHECYYVGGCVRDELLGMTPADYDLATNAKPEELFSLFADTHKTTYAGEAFKVVRVEDIEIATYRKDCYFGNSDKNCVIEYAATISEDLSRRDLSVNAMAKCAKTGKLVDPFGGKDDLEKKIVRFVGDPFERIKEDPNRMIRACRFVALLDGRFHPDTLEAIQKSHHLFKYVAKERISYEIMKAMKIKKASRFFLALWECGLLKFIFPTLDKCIFHDGGPHHNEDLFEHAMTAGDFLSTRCSVLKLAGYLHDVGKVGAYDPEERTFIGHEFVGEKVVRKELKDLKFSNEVIDKIAAYVRLHMRNASGSEKSVRKLVREFQIHNINYRAHTRLKLADRAGNRNKPNFKYSNIKDILLSYENLFKVDDNSVFSLKDLKVNGSHLLHEFNMTPGKKVGEMLNFALESVLDGNVENDRQQLLDHLRSECFYVQ